MNIPKDNGSGSHVRGIFERRNAFEPKKAEIEKNVIPNSIFGFAKADFAAGGGVSGGSGKDRVKPLKDPNVPEYFREGYEAPAPIKDPNMLWA